MLCRLVEAGPGRGGIAARGLESREMHERPTVLDRSGATAIQLRGALDLALSALMLAPLLHHQPEREVASGPRPVLVDAVLEADRHRSLRELLGRVPGACLGGEEGGAAQAGGLVQVLSEGVSDAGVFERPLFGLVEVPERAVSKPDRGGADAAPGRLLALRIE